MKYLFGLAAMLLVGFFAAGCGDGDGDDDEFGCDDVQRVEDLQKKSQDDGVLDNSGNIVKKDEAKKILEELEKIENKIPDEDREITCDYKSASGKELKDEKIKLKDIKENLSKTIERFKKQL